MNAEILKSSFGAEKDAADNTPIPPRSPAPSSTFARPPSSSLSASPLLRNSEVESFLQSGERMLEMQRRKMIELESAHEIGRVKLIDTFRTRLLELEHEAGEALRKYDVSYEGDRAAQQRILDALVRMRA